MKSIVCCSILLYAVPGVSGEALRSDLATKVKKRMKTTIESRNKANTLLLENQSEGARSLTCDCVDCTGGGTDSSGDCGGSKGTCCSTCFCDQCGACSSKDTCNKHNCGSTKAPTETPTKAPTKAPTEMPTEVPTDAPTASYTPELTAKGQQCAAGHAIDIKDECETAIQGATWKGEKPSRNRQYGCYYIERADEVFFNPTPVTKRRVWKHSKGVCKGGDFEATLTYKEAAKKGRNCANGEVVIIESDCKAAANELGKSFKKSVTSKTRPAGCYFKGGKAWFNTITTAYAKGRYGKFTGVCKAGN